MAKEQIGLTMRAKMAAPAWGFWLGLLVVLDGAWIGLDRSVPAWDQADHLGRALEYAQIWRDPQWGSGAWWQQMWRLSPSYRAPLLYLLTVPVFGILGAGWHQAMLVNTVVSLPLWVMVRAILGGWAGLDPQKKSAFTSWAGWILFVPFLMVMRMTYFLDYVLMVVVTGTWLALTRWRQAQGIPKWGWAAAVGMGMGLTVLARPTGILFLGVPVVWCFLEPFLGKADGKGHGKERQLLLTLLQGIPAALIALVICGFWVQNNWLTILTSIDKARAWGDLYQNTGIPAWWFYLTWLPQFFGWPLLILGVIGWLRGVDFPLSQPPQTSVDWLWVGLFLGSGYALCALSPSYDPRFILPILPVAAGLLVLGVLRLGRRWCWIGLGLSLGMTVIQQFFAPTAPDYRGGWPHEAVIQTVIEQAPWQRSTLGVVPTTAAINPFTINFYGTLRQFQVYGRQLSYDPSTAVAESQALDWYLTKTGSQGIVTGVEDGQLAQWQAVIRNPNLERLSTWPLPDQSTLELWRRRDPRLTVVPLDSPPEGDLPVLVSVDSPEQAQVGSVIPITYVWQGSPKVLTEGVVLLDWRRQDGLGWIQDHTIGFGNLRQASVPGFEVRERVGMGIPNSPGVYRLQARYLHGQQAIPIALPAPVEITITDASQTSPRDPDPPEVLDTLSLFRQLGRLLRQGQLDPVFREVARINQHDPIQSYYTQIEQSLSYRLYRDHPDLSLELDSAYSLMLVQVLQQKALAALETLNLITTLDVDNPYPWMYQAVVHLYRWNGRAAQVALEQAQARDPGIPELPALKRVTALQRLDLPAVIQG